MSGATHSHDPEFPDDDWNLYSMLDPSTTALNVTKPDDAIRIFKPHAHRLSEDPAIMSDADGEIIVVMRFTSPCHIRKIMVIGGGEDDKHPALLKCYVNKENIDFSSIESFSPAQEFPLPVNTAGTVELITVVQPFTNVTSMAFYFPRNHGEVDQTVIKYIGLQGEHTHYRREAVDTVYEVLCTGQDIQQPEDALGQAHNHDHSHSHGHGHDHTH